MPKLRKVATSLWTEMVPSDGLVITKVAVKYTLEHPWQRDRLIDIDEADLDAINNGSCSYDAVRFDEQLCSAYLKASTAFLLRLELCCGPTSGPRRRYDPRRLAAVMRGLKHPRYSQQLSRAWRTFLMTDDDSMKRVLLGVGYTALLKPVVEHFRDSLLTGRSKSRAATLETSSSAASQRSSSQGAQDVMTASPPCIDSSVLNPVQPTVDLREEPIDNDVDCDFDLDEDLMGGWTTDSYASTCITVAT